ncbi:MAG: thiamine-monophosphate kinase, partial [Caulobacteraceae bacterium]
ALAELASLGDDYEVVATAPPDRVEGMIATAAGAGIVLTVIGEAVDGGGVTASFAGADVAIARKGWTHG